MDKILEEYALNIDLTEDEYFDIYRHKTESQ